MGGQAPHDLSEHVDLIPQLDPRLVGTGARRRLAGIADEASLGVHEGGHAPRARHGGAQGEVEMHAHPQARGLQLLELRGRDLAVHEERGARHDARPPRFENAAAYALRQAEVVGVDDEALRRLRHCFPMTFRKYSRSASLSWARAPGWVWASSICSRSS